MRRPPPGALPTLVGVVAGELVVGTGRTIVASVVGAEEDEEVGKGENVTGKPGLTTTAADVVVVIDTDCMCITAGAEAEIEIDPTAEVEFAVVELELGDTGAGALGGPSKISSWGPLANPLRAL